MKVIKRDGKLVEFNISKIERVIELANKSVPTEHRIDSEKMQKILAFVSTQLNKIKETEVPVKDNGETHTVKEKCVEVEKIQDIVEEALMNKNCYEVARAFIACRDERAKERFKRLGITKEIKEKLDASNVQNQNANLDEHSFGGRKGEAESALLKQMALDYYISPKFAKNHINNRIYIHDLDSYVIGMHNCLSLPIDELLANGAVTRQVKIRPAGSVNTAFQLVAVYFQLQSLQQFGGVAATHVDWTMVPYVRKSFMKHYIVAYLKSTDDFVKLNLPDLMFKDYQDEAGIWHNELDDWIDSNKDKYLKELNLSFDDFKFSNKKNLDKFFYQSAMYDTIIEIRQAAEGMFHNLNSLQSRSGNQLPFSSINYGTCTLDEGRVVTRAILETSLKGVGNGETSIFPCQIFQYWKGVNDKPGTPNYDLYKLAIRSTSKRLYPNYCNVDWSNDAGFNKDDPRTYPSTMGCLAGKEHLYVKIEDTVYDISIEDFFNFGKTGKFKNARLAQVFFNKDRTSKKGNKHIQEKSGITPGAGVYAITYIPNDVTYIGSSSNVCRRWGEHKCHIKLTGGLDSGVCFGDSNTDNYKFEVLEYTEDYEAAEKKYIEKNATVNFKGTSQRYYKVNNSSKDVYDRPTWNLNPAKKQELYTFDGKDVKVLDIDGNWVKVRHVFKNNKHNSPYMMHIYYMEDGKTFCISATEDHPFFNGEGFTKAGDLKIGDTLYRADNKELTVTKVTYHWTKVESFDIGTESGTFIGSDIKMHNCRTYSSKDINAPSEELSHLKDGRGNIAPATIIMPTLAMEAKKKAEKNGHPEYVVDNFLDILEKAISDCKDELIERYNWICAQNPASAKFMYQNNTFFSYNKDFETEGIRGALKHGTLAIGQLGLAETLQILVGCDHTDPRGMAVAKQIEQLFKTKAAEYKENYRLNFGVYFTPAESTCYTAMKKFKKKYGVIPNVSDHDYFTNSIHVPVWKEIDPFEKIDIESQLTGYSSAGCITYVEIGDKASDNLEALEQIVNYAMAKDVPYFALNLPLSHCTVCGSDENIDFDASCPHCGAEPEEVEHLARVTGYLSTTFRHFNTGKQSEVRERYTHVNKLQNWKK